MIRTYEFNLVSLSDSDSALDSCELNCDVASLSFQLRKLRKIEFQNITYLYCLDLAAQLEELGTRDRKS